MLAQYSYLGGSPPAPSLYGSGRGSGAFVITDYTQPSIKWTMPTLDGSNDPDTGDIYTGFDRFGRVKDNRLYNYGTSTDVDRIKYGYDRNGNRTYRQNVVATANGANFDELYQNDLIDRLKRMDRGQLTALKDSITNNTFAQCWTLDETGNWTGFREDDTGDGTWNLEQTRTANAVNEITSITESVGPTWVTPEYDAAGNMIIMPSVADPTVAQTCTYDAWNRLVKVMQGSSTVSAYGYDAAKRRNIQLTFTAGILSETRHLYYTEPSTWLVVEERIGAEPDGSPAERQFVWGRRYIDDLIVRDRNENDGRALSERIYAIQDANWNVTAIIGLSTVQERFIYSAYGTPTYLTMSFNPISDSGFKWETLFSAYRRNNIGVYVARHRHYTTVVGMWMYRDLVAPTTTNQSLYEYVQSAPLAKTDPSGLAPYASCIPLGYGPTLRQGGVNPAGCNYECVCSNGVPHQVTLGVAPDANCGDDDLLALAIASGDLNGDCDNSDDERPPKCPPMPMPILNPNPLRLKRPVPVSSLAQFVALAALIGLFLTSPAAGTLIVVFGVVYVLSSDSGGGA